MLHRNARLTVHVRQLLVDPVLSGRPVAHVAKVDVSRQCAHRWVARDAADGEAGMQDRSSRPKHSPRRTSSAVEAAVVAARRKHRRGPTGWQLSSACRTAQCRRSSAGTSCPTWLTASVDS
jgi:hypothetical protein